MANSFLKIALSALDLKGYESAGYSMAAIYNFDVCVNPVVASRMLAEYPLEPFNSQSYGMNPDPAGIITAISFHCHESFRIFRLPRQVAARFLFPPRYVRKSDSLFPERPYLWMASNSASCLRGLYGPSTTALCGDRHPTEDASWRMSHGIYAETSSRRWERSHICSCRCRSSHSSALPEER